MTWRCEDCEAVHETHDPPCDSCGSDALVSATEPTAVESVETFVWTCRECGREHVKNSPPCARCGQPILERREPTYEGADPATDGYLSVAKPYFPVVALLAVVIGLTASGIVTPEMLPGHGPPDAPDAPGQGETAAGLDLGTVEMELHDALEAERASRGAASRAYDADLAAFAEYTNRQAVLEASDEDAGDRPLLTEYYPNCTGDATLGQLRVLIGDPASFDDERTMAEAVLAGLLADATYESAVTERMDREGFNLHVVEERVFFTYVSTTCR